MTWLLLAAGACIVAALAYELYAGSPVVPLASMFTGKTGGCGDFSVYCFDRTGTLALHVVFSERSHPLMEGEQSFLLKDLKKGDGDIEVLQFRSAPDSYFCDDVAGDPSPIVRWKAVSARMVVEYHVGKPPPELRNATHRVTVRLEDVHLECQGRREEAVLDRVEIKDVWVGWLPG